MKHLLIALTLVMLFACKEGRQASQPNEKAVSEKVAASSVFNVVMDTLSSESKESELKGAHIDEDQWRDTVCGTCNRRCCSPCTAGGNVSQCAETRFTNCSKCNHLSANHYSAPH